jgi:multidrug efflux pump subunit AcrB
MGGQMVIHLIPNQEKQHKHDKTSEELAKEVAQFLANGGGINQVPNGVSGEKPKAKKTYSIKARSETRALIDTVQARVNELVKEHKSVNKAADALNIGRTHLLRLSRGEAHNPGYEILRKLGLKGETK